MSESISPVTWRRSSRCEATACVEVARVDGGVAIRDSENPDASLIFNLAEWARFVDGIRANEFDFN